METISRENLIKAFHTEKSAKITLYYFNSHSYWNNSEEYIHEFNRNYNVLRIGEKYYSLKATYTERHEYPKNGEENIYSNFTGGWDEAILKELQKNNVWESETNLGDFSEEEIADMIKIN
jgi:hypothetical protein